MRENVWVWVRERERLCGCARCCCAVGLIMTMYGQISFWVAKEVCGAPSLKQRVAFLKHFVHMAWVRTILGSEGVGYVRWCAQVHV
jgi:hypothetical protein